MKKILLGIGIILVIIWFLMISKNQTGLTAPGFMQQITHSQPVLISTPAPTPNAPKSFNFDSSTDLKAELEKVNPQVLDSDFQ